MISILYRILCALGLLLIVAPFASAQVITIDRIPDVVEPLRRDQIGAVSIAEQVATISIDNQIATVSIEQVFHSSLPQIAEGTYIFPIPDDAAISQFSLWMGGKEVAGSVLEAAEARSIYQGIVSRMRDPGLLEFVGSRMFQCRVFPIPANGDMKIRLTYQQILRAESGVVSLSYPLNVSRFTKQPLRRMSITADIRDKGGVKTVFSPSHGSAVALNRLDDKHARISFEQSQAIPDRDFLLYYGVSNETVGISAVAHRSMGNDGYFLMMLSPKMDIPQAEIAPKDIVFVLDTSGSMNDEGGVKLTQAKAALRHCIQSLNAGDRFNIISFNMDIRKFKDQVIDVSADSRQWGVQFVDSLQAAGGTNINDALLAALAMRQSGDSRLFMVCFITDGMPSVGVREPADILRNVKTANAANSRVYVFGVGTDLNATLLDAIADQNRGGRTYVNAGDDMETRMSEFSNKIQYPVLSNLRLTIGGLETYSIYPQQLPDLFKGSQLIVSGRYKGDGSHVITLRGDANGKEQTFTFEAAFPKDNIQDSSIAAIWANQRVAALLEEVRFRGSNKEIVDEIVRLGKEFGIVTPYTSYLVVEEAELGRMQGDGGWDRPMPAANGPAAPEQALREIHIDSAHAEEDYQAGDAADQANKTMDQDTSAEGVALSKSIDNLKKADASGGGGFSGDSNDDDETFNQRRSLSIVRALDKSFLLRQGVYVESELTAEEIEKAVSIRFMSPEFLELMGKDPRYAKYLAVHSFLVIKLENTVYFIHDFETAAGSENDGK